MNATTVAVAQFAPVHGDVAANLALIRTLIERGAASGAGLVVFPELATTGYAWTSAGEVAPFAEPVPGPVTGWLTEQCREYGCHVVLGLVERAGRPLYNTAVLVGPGGLAGRYRKAKLWSWDTLWATAGDQPPAVWQTPVGRVGVLICADLDYPEGTSWLARAGADLIAVPTCWSDDPAPSPVWRARAHDSGIPFAVANVSGTEWGVTFAAGSCVIGDDGRLLDRVADGQGLAVAAVDLSAGLRRRAQRAGGMLSAGSEAFEALDRNAQLFPSSQIPGISARPRPVAPVRVAVVQGSAEGAAEASLTALAGRLTATGTARERPALAVLPALLAADLAADPRLLSRLARACGRHAPTEFVVSVLDERSGQTTVLLADSGAVVTSVTVSPGGVRTGDGAPLRPILRAWGAVGLLTVAELLRPEPARCLAINGSDLIAATGRFTGPPVEAATVGVPPFDLWRVRAGENNCYFAVANVTLPDGSGGRSALHGPDYYDQHAARVTLNGTEERAASLALTLDPATPVGRESPTSPFSPSAAPSCIGLPTPGLYGSAERRNLPAGRYRGPELHRQGVLDERRQCILDGRAFPGVALDHRHVRADRQRLLHFGDVVRELAIEPVHRYDERQPCGFEIVHRRERVGQPTSIHQHHRPDRAMDEVVPHEPEPSLSGRAEQVQDQACVERRTAEVHRHGRHGLVRGERQVVEILRSHGHHSLGGQRRDLGNRADERGLAHAETARHHDLHRGHSGVARRARCRLRVVEFQ